MKKLTSEHSPSELAYLARFMSGLHEDKDRLRDIQSVYDNLTLLGQLLCSGTDITAMRNDYGTLATVLLDQLAQELRKKAVLGLGSNARVAIDVLIRNLFERTADIGFLATDSEIRNFAQASAGEPAGVDAGGRRSALISRFAEYVGKYSVYHNIMLFAVDGRLLVQLDENNPVTTSSDPLIGESLTTEKAYVETFRATDLLPGQDSPLVYSYRVMSEDGRFPVGVLCLCFRFQDECRRIFRNLVSDDDWSVITLLSPDGRIIASSDIYQFPIGAKLERVLDEECRIVRFAGREYLATTRETKGYQGYGGPGWVAHVLSPLGHAFEMAVARELEHVPQDILRGVLETSTLFSPELRNIPVRAASIQNQLNQAVWNGNIWLTRDVNARNSSFAKVLLWEIGSTGIRTRKVFIESTTNLYQTVVSSVLRDCSAQASLAIEVMDRNLYERANDCRWWALTAAFRDALSRLRQGESPPLEPLSEILRTINGLYTVYSNLVLFDASGRIVAVSNPVYAGMIGQTLPHDWARQTLGLPDTDSYCVSPFSPSPLYDERPTYVYSAAIREIGTGSATGTAPVGGIAIVFDAAPQFAAMLHDALPRGEDGSIAEGAFAVFAERDGTVIASTDETLSCGMRLEIPREFLDVQQAAGCSNIIAFRDRYYALGSRLSVGYREYKSERDSYRNNVVALIFVPLSRTTAGAADAGSMRCMSHENQLERRVGGDDCVEMATFYINRSWYGIRVEHALAAIEKTVITGMPGMPPWVRGCIMHHQQALPVLDLSSFLAASQGKAATCTESEQIVLIHLPEHQVSYGILVDSLGEILDVPRSRIEPIPQMISDALPLTESLVRPHEDDLDKRILVVLSAEQLLRRLTGKDNVLAEIGLDFKKPVTAVNARSFCDAA
jgi:chemotaxis signal transduction protein